MKKEREKGSRKSRVRGKWEEKRNRGRERKEERKEKERKNKKRNKILFHIKNVKKLL